MCSASKIRFELEIGVESHDKLYRNPFLDPLKPHELKPTSRFKGNLNAKADIDRLYDYDLLSRRDSKSVKTIAMVGASGDKTKFSYGVLRQLNEIGYDILPQTQTQIYQRSEA